MDMEEKLQEMADNLTNEIMSFVYGERFEKCEDITEDDELSGAWEYISERTFGVIWTAYDDGYDEGCDDSELL